AYPLFPRRNSPAVSSRLRNSRAASNATHGHHQTDRAKGIVIAEGEERVGLPLSKHVVRRKTGWYLHETWTGSLVQRLAVRRCLGCSMERIWWRSLVLSLCCP